MKLTYLASLATGWTSIINKRIIQYNAQPKDVDKKVVLDAVNNAKRILEYMEQEIQKEDHEKTTQTPAYIRTQESQSVSTAEAAKAIQQRL